jgi:hypothetical protein
MNETVSNTNDNSLNLAVIDSTSTPLTSLVPAPLTDLQRRAAMFRVTPDPDLEAKIEDTSDALEFLESARDRLAYVPGYLAALGDIYTEIELQMAEQSARLAKLEVKMEESLKSAISIAEREAREKCRAFVHQGHGTRPVVSEATISSVQGELRLICQSCEHVIVRVDTSMLAGGLSADAFADLSGHPLFDGDNPKGWRCPGCTLGPIIDPRWILTDSWRFYEVGAQETGSPNKNAPEAHKGGLTGGLSNQSARVAVALIC